MMTGTVRHVRGILRTAVCGAVALGVAAVVVGAASAASEASRFGPITFTAPAALPGGTVGKAYSYSFCRPARSQCGRTSAHQAQQNPTGGLDRTYRVQLKAGSRLPAGLALNASSGVLHGRPTAAGTSSFTVCVTDRGRPLKGRITWGPACRTTRLAVAPSGPAPDFDLAAAPAALNLTAGQAGAASVITVGAKNGFAGVVTFSSTAPAGFTVTFAPAASATTTSMTVAAALTAPLGATTLTVTGAGGGKTHTTTVTVTVVAPPPLIPDFAGSWRASTYTAQIVAPGCTADGTGTVTVSLVQAGAALAAAAPGFQWTLAEVHNIVGAAAACNAALAALDTWNGSIAFAGVIGADGTAAGSGFTIRKQTDNALSVTYAGVVAGAGVTATFTMFRF